MNPNGKKKADKAAAIKNNGSGKSTSPKATPVKKEREINVRGLKIPVGKTNNPQPSRRRRSQEDLSPQKQPPAPEPIQRELPLQEQPPSPLPVQGELLLQEGPPAEKPQSHQQKLPLQEPVPQQQQLPQPQKQQNSYEELHPITILFDWVIKKIFTSETIQFIKLSISASAIYALTDLLHSKELLGKNENYLFSGFALLIAVKGCLVLLCGKETLTKTFGKISNVIDRLFSKFTDKL